MEQKKQLISSVNRTRISSDNVNLSVSISKIKKNTHELSKMYDFKKYMDSSDMHFPEEMDEMIPKDTPPYLDNGEHYVERIGRALKFFKQCALIGPSGTGKTHIVYLVAELAGLPMWEINCGLATSVFDLFGRYVGLGKENWIDGLITGWCRKGGILYLDEANMMKQDVATKLNPLLDQRGHMVLTEKDSEIIHRHKHAYMIISMNPVSSEFAGTKPINAAMRRRMSVWLNFDYMSVGDNIDEKEINMVSKKGGIPMSDAEVIVKAGAKIRQEYKMGDLPYGPSVGDLVNWAKICSDGMSIIDGGNETLIPMTSDDPEVQDEVRHIVKKIIESHVAAKKKE
ncbi:AAA family ATPase [Nitrosopumilus sp.]|uniref:AAA family ATPase n=1 Tax=Nitrosopumilus sp. TaxID=2024843 RepID=UPI00247C8ACE|nr:AAA family ATPase [Nitrosopumilus sp.]MCV0430093.1 CbbQ/NirQ/NorQ/GpvN family protein [Nitrosopumilus sp.]